MPDLDRINQCRMLAKALWFLPPPARAQIADGLYGLGVRVHPELATKELLADGPPGLGNHLRQELVSINSDENLLSFLHHHNPELAAAIEAATTPEAKRAVLAEIASNHPGLVGHAQRWLHRTAPEDLG